MQESGAIPAYQVVVPHVQIDDIDAGRGAGRTRGNGERRNHRHAVARGALRIGPGLGRVAQVIAYPDRSAPDRSRSSENTEVVRLRTTQNFKIRASGLNTVSKGQADTMAGCVTSFISPVAPFS